MKNFSLPVKHFFKILFSQPPKNKTSKTAQPLRRFAFVSFPKPRRVEEVRILPTKKITSRPLTKKITHSKVHCHSQKTTWTTVFAEIEFIAFCLTLTDN